MHIINISHYLVMGNKAGGYAPCLFELSFFVSFFFTLSFSVSVPVCVSVSVSEWIFYVLQFKFIIVKYFSAHLSLLILQENDEVLRLRIYAKLVLHRALQRPLQQ